MLIKRKQVRVMTDELYRDTLTYIAGKYNISPEDVERELLEGIKASWASAGILIRFHQKTPLLKSTAHPLTPKEFLSFMTTWFRSP